MSGGADVSRSERQARFLLRAYPREWRDERGEELVATILDLASDRPDRWMPPRLVLDLVVGGWRQRANRHVAARGVLAAGWRFAVSVAVVAQLIVAVLWLRDWVSTGTPVVLAHVLGGVSEATYVAALVAFTVGAVAWLAGVRRIAKTAGGLAITTWLLTVIVLNLLTAPMATDWLQVVEWTYLAALATVGLFQPSPEHRKLVSGVVLIVLVAAQFLSTGVVPMSAQTSLYVQQPTLPIDLLARGANTLHTALRTGWTLFALTGLALVGVDRRLVVAALWLFPFVGLGHLYWSGPVGPSIGILAALALLVLGLVRVGRSAPDGGSGPSW